MDQNQILDEFKNLSIHNIHVFILKYINETLIKEMIINYMIEKTSEQYVTYDDESLMQLRVNALHEWDSDISLTGDSRISILIHSFKYFGFCPDFLSHETLEDNGLIEKYFMWIKKGEYNAFFLDENNSIVYNENENITSENFTKNNWRLAQLNAFYLENIVPILLKKCDINININNEKYKELLIIPNYHYNDLKMLINDFINGKRDFLTDQNIIDINNGVINSKIYYITRSLIKVKDYQKSIKKSLNKKLKKIVIDRTKKRFKWQSLCERKLNELDIQELQELAYQERIPYYLMLTKQELCVKFAKKYEDVIYGKLNIENKCINTTSILGTDIVDIPPEFFFNYTHNGKVYCDDIRDLHKHFMLNGGTHPIDRTILSSTTVHNVGKWYTYLINITNTMEDFDEPIVPVISLLTQKVTNLLAKLNYPKNGILYINSTEENYKKFINELHNNHILRQNEVNDLIRIKSLNESKSILIDVLLLHIRSDPNQMMISGQRDPLSSVAIEISNIYNSVF